MCSGQLEGAEGSHSGTGGVVRGTGKGSGRDRGVGRRLEEGGRT